MDFMYCGANSLSNNFKASRWTCANGELITQGPRIQDNHCGSCGPGYKLNNKQCVACDETIKGAKQDGYRGCQNKTKSGFGIKITTKICNFL